MKHRFKRKTLTLLNYIAFPLIFVVGWELLGKSGAFTPILMPPVETLGRTLIRCLTNGQIASDLAASFVRVAWGYSIGVLLGLTFGIAMGAFAWVNKFFSIFFNAMRQIPPLAWIPLFILWFGIGETSKVVLITTSAFFPILINTVAGISSLPGGYLELAGLYGISKRDLIFKLYLPNGLPSIFTGLRLGVGSAWMSVVASEIIVATSGIGYRINDARNLMDSDVVIVNMFIIGIIGLLMDVLLRKVEKALPICRYART
jgi:sulfonate transport system permease protein